MSRLIFWAVVGYFVWGHFSSGPDHTAESIVRDIEEGKPLIFRNKEPAPPAHYVSEAEAEEEHF